MKALVTIIAVLALSLTGAVASANQLALAPVTINGSQLTFAQLRVLEAQLGGRVEPGHYMVNARGCWLNLSTGASGCIGQGSASTDVHSRHGSGSRQGGNWNHWSNAAGGAVGGTADGCIYTTFGYSNC